MATGGSAIRGSRVGSGPMGEKDHGHQVERRAVSYWDAYGNETVRHFAAEVADDDIPVLIDCPTSGLPAGRDRNDPPAPTKLLPYKSHLDYVKERRSADEAEHLLDEALTKLRARRGTAQ